MKAFTATSEDVLRNPAGCGGRLLPISRQRRIPRGPRMDTSQHDASPARSGSGDPARRGRRASRRARAAGLKAKARPGLPGPWQAGFAPPLTALTASRAPSHAISAAS